jgi:hypothetical protein
MPRDLSMSKVRIDQSSQLVASSLLLGRNEIECSGLPLPRIVVTSRLVAKSQTLAELSVEAVTIRWLSAVNNT